MVVLPRARAPLTICALIIVVFNVIDTSSIQTDEVKRIIFQYYLACGAGNICNTTLIETNNIENISQYNQEILHMCPKCACDDMCYTRRDCCPDIYFTKVSQSCKSFVVTSTQETLDSYLVVDSCPQGTPSHLSDACRKDYSATEGFFHPPVTSNTTSLSYRNEFCAECNSDFSVVPWSWYVRCRKPQDFNFVSSYSDLLQKAGSSDCIVEYAPFRSPVSRCPQIAEKNNFINKCNMSRTWTNWNPDILKGCESGYENRFGIFQNVFCHLCNPPLQKSTTSEETTLPCSSESDNDNLIAACKNLPSLESFGRNKNGFCLKCISEGTMDDTFMDLEATVDEQYNSEGFFEYNLQLQSFHENFIKRLIEERAVNPKYSNGRAYSISNIESRVTEDTGSVMLRVNADHMVNLTNIAQKYFALEPKRVCNEDLLPQNLSSFATLTCSCDPACLFIDSCNCCMDTALLSSTKCISDKVLSTTKRNESHFLTTSACRNRGLDPMYFRIISDLCNAEETGVLSIPVFQKSSGVTYRNIFCLMCNEQMSMSSVLPIITDKYYIWDMKISCSRRIDSNNTGSVNDLINLGKIADCGIKLIPKSARKCPTYEEKMISKCNETGFWMEQDEDIQWACENVSTSLLPPYANRKNVFCNLCNPIEKYGGGITTECNKTGNWLEYDPVMEQGCKQLPFIPNAMLYPFKNDFCAFCNGYDVPHYVSPSMYCIKMNGEKHDETDKNSEKMTPVSVVTVFQNDAPVDNSDEVSSIFDPLMKIKRHIYCYPGRHLVGNDCSVLIPNSIHLRYSLTLALEGHMAGEGQRMLRMIRGAIFTHLREKLGIRSLDIQTSYLMSNVSCLSTASQTEEHKVKILFHGSLYLRGPIERGRVERVLFDLHQPNEKMLLENEFFNFTFVTSNEAYNIPTLINSGKSRGRCFLSDQNLMPKENVKQTIFISKMLFCKQIQFRRSEFTYDEVRIQLKLRKFNRTFHNEEFYLTSTGEMRICLEDFMSLLSNVKTSSFTTDDGNKDNNDSNTLEWSTLLFIGSILITALS